MNLDQNGNKYSYEYFLGYSVSWWNHYCAWRYRKEMMSKAGPLCKKKFVIIPNGVSNFNVLDKNTALSKLVGEQKAKDWIAEKGLL